MASELRFDDKVVIVTGAGGGLGRAHALLFGARGAKVVVNDLGGSTDGTGESAAFADRVVSEIREAGGEATASYDSVEDGAKIVQTALDAYGRVDVLINNAGILRDVSFHKMTDADWDLVYRVHVKGSYAVTHAAWPHMREQRYGRIVMTASAAGIYGNFGQANYAMAKLGLAGFANTLAVEGRKRGIHVNTIAPLAGSRLTETVLPKELLEALDPAYVSPLVGWLCHEECEETGGLFEVGGGFFGKLRWERAAGKMYRVGRAISIEDLRGSWDAIAGFDGETEHPESIAASMQPIMGNLERGPSKGGNALIDVDEALGHEFEPVVTSYDEKDLALYALGVGADDLAHVYEMDSGFCALPTFGVVPVVNALMDQAKRGVQAPGLRYGFDRILHGEQLTELKRPLPQSATLTHKARITDIFDKGKGALVITEVDSYDEDGELLIHNRYTTYVRGAGGWGGERGPSAEVNVPPDRAPDAVVEEAIPENQALLYRLSGDWNPLHADPAFAKAFGFDRPILHGLCTFGYAGRHVISKMAPGGDPRLFHRIKVRFAESVYPGETLVTEMWREGEGKIVFRCKVKERDEVVISHAAIELYDAVPEKKAKPAPKKASTKTEAAEATSADIFRAIGILLETDPGRGDKVGHVFGFSLSDPVSEWTIDVSSGNGSVSRGRTKKPDCTLELSDRDFMDMCTGKADAQKLYFGGQLKIGGNVMASQKLSFLKKVTPEMVTQAVSERGGADAAPAKEAANEAPLGSTSADIFAAIAHHVAANPDLASRVGHVFLFKLSEPESAWTLDLRDGAGALEEGETKKADCTLEISDESFVAMATGKADAQKLYFGGQLKIGGNVMASQKLTFLADVDRDAAVDAMREARTRRSGAGASTPAPRAPTREPAASGIFERLAQASSLAAELGSAAIQFRVTEPDALFYVRGSEVTEGEVDAPAATFTLADEDLAALVAGTGASELFQRGKLRVDGDLTLARRLDLLQQLES